MEMEEGLDTGPMLLIERTPITPQDTTATLHDKLAAMGAGMMVKVLRKMEQGVVEAVPQPEQGVTYANKILKDEAVLDFSQPAREISRKIRAFNPFPGAHGEVNGTVIKLWGAEVLDQGSSALPGQVIAADAQHGIVVACGEGALRLTQLQKPGGKRLPAAEFIKGFPLDGQRFQ
jgi:methionyl-tRNA formyltransferase